MISAGEVINNDSIRFPLRLVMPVGYDAISNRAADNDTRKHIPIYFANTDYIGRHAPFFLFFNIEAREQKKNLPSRLPRGKRVRSCTRDRAWRTIF